MKTTKLLSIALLAMAVCLGLTSCSKDEEEGITLEPDEFKSGNLYYKITSENTVEVINPTSDLYGGPPKKIVYKNTIIIPQEVTYKENIYQVTSIGRDAFYNCTKLTSVEIPGSVTEIGKRAFYGCTDLRSVNIPKGVTTIESETFCGCLKLTPNIPNTVKIIRIDAFGCCNYPEMQSINIPNGVTTIENNAFYHIHTENGGGGCF